ncbi:hypothetical protein T069G_09806 [Trichoderma breve]|uniref:Uncharacterized protein n=1 Tax=Trichoderma breve TaxID=2034170 RepID=A0A9W9BAM4_9HYPO|nr:hypothetical protein T069G_09806 [Trichoderma breve]KAJ4856438.1 hypothetical protein T069G_09806 [Trichoderma breve]
MQFRGGKAQRKDARAHNANARPWVLVLVLVLFLVLGLEVLDIRGPNQPANERLPPPVKIVNIHARFGDCKPNKLWRLAATEFRAASLRPQIGIVAASNTALGPQAPSPAPPPGNPIREVA